MILRLNNVYFHLEDVLRVDFNDDGAEVLLAKGQTESILKVSDESLQWLRNVLDAEHQFAIENLRSRIGQPSTE